MDEQILIEVCTDNYEDAIKAEHSGASRIELCTSIAEGGITPPLSLIEKVCSSVKIPVHVMVRPRAGDFLYTNVEFELMQSDILHALKSGASGVVFGILNEDGSIDIERCRILFQLAEGMRVTFHRAFDMTSDAFLALEELVTIGFDSILTSGQNQTAEDGLEVIRELVKRSGNRITIMAGGGINSRNVRLLHEAGIKAFHFTCRKQVPGKMIYKNDVIRTLANLNSVSEYDVFDFDQSKMDNILSVLKSAGIK